MNAKRLYFVLIGCIVLLAAGLLGGAYGINSMLAGKSTKLVSLKAQTAALSSEQTDLAKAKREVAKYSSLEQIAQSIVPQDKNQAEAVREIVNIAAANNVALASITFPASNLGQAKATGSSASKVPSQLTPVPGITGVYDLEITLTSDTNHPVTFTQFTNFLSSLENNRRTAEVSTVSLNPLATNHSYLTFTLTLDEYLKP
ncbi:MAG TPA: hypothetical protein VHD60_02905 [Candidatus Saccharimonadales bacterium]|nr:hypothetical protein [Candidatus Saccharimonadales bacterium]